MISPNQEQLKLKIKLGTFAYSLLLEGKPKCDAEKDPSINNGAS